MKFQIRRQESPAESVVTVWLRSFGDGVCVVAKVDGRSKNVVHLNEAGIYRHGSAQGIGLPTGAQGRIVDCTPSDPVPAEAKPKPDAPESPTTTANSEFIPSLLWSLYVQFQEVGFVEEHAFRLVRDYMIGFSSNRGDDKD